MKAAVICRGSPRGTSSRAVGVGIPQGKDALRDVTGTR
jgi:hypothetical protein